MASSVFRAVGRGAVRRPPAAQRQQAAARATVAAATFASSSASSSASSVAAAVDAAAAGDGKFTLPELPYDYGALEPAISADIMRTHHTKHHQTYTNNLNKTLDAMRSTADVGRMVALQPALNFNGGGFLNHSIFWTNLAPQSAGGGRPPAAGSSPLARAIEHDFESTDALMNRMNAAAAGIQGSGWAWLVHNATTGRLEVVTRANQDPVVGVQTPLLGIDAWEHAYYLQYKNDKASYFKNIWSVVNWTNVEERLQAASAASKS